MIVSAWIDDEDLESFHLLRERFFPRVRSVRSAHVTLFHHLPGPKRAEVLAGIGEVVDAFRHPALDRARGHADVWTRGVFCMGRGVAYALERDFLMDLRGALATRFRDDLKPQDARPWRNPHITVQNKVEPAEAQRLRRHLEAAFEPCRLRVRGVQAWRYDYGPWTLLRAFPFARGASAGGES